MIILRRVLYFIREAWQNIKSSLLTNLVAVFTISLALTIFSFFVIFFVNMGNVLDAFGAQVQVITYLKDDLMPEGISSVKEKVGSFKEVESVNHVSKERAIQIFRDELKGQKGILDGLGANPLPASFEINLKKPFRNSSGVNALVTRLKGLDGIDDIQYGQEWVDRFSAFLNFFKAGGFIVGLFLFIATIFIISNTIRLTVYARRDEIEIMRLVGATETFIRVPFFIEGLLEGLSGAVLALGIIYAGKYILLNNVPASFAGLINIPFSTSDFMLILLSSGAAIGLFGSFVSLGRFLRQG